MMYYLIYGVVYLVSLLPWFILYGIGDFVYAILYYVTGYRKKVVFSNLRIAFPEKSEEELTAIAKKFYHNFVDNFIEAIKLLSISQKELSKRFIMDPAPVNALYESGKNVQLHAMHNFNWEVGNLCASNKFVYPFIAVYMPISYPPLDRLFLNLRSRFGTLLVPATDFKNSFRKYIKDRYVLALATDQNPGSPINAYWLPFFGKLTPFVTGPEKGARINNTAVIFCEFYKLKRGHYELDLHLFTENPRELPEGEITRKFVRYMEDCIRKRPDNYLWSHKRWKWEYTEDYAANRIDI